jgi:two-component system LytT family sensor kinase
MGKIRNRFVELIIHTIVWLCLFFYPFLFHFVPINDGRAFLRIFLSLALMIFFFYSNAFILIPKLLQAKKIVFYSLSVIAFVVFTAYSNALIQLLLNPEITKKPDLFNTAWNSGLFASIAAWIISSGLKITGEWFRSEEKRKSTEHEKLRSELSFLRTQVNPHFLFNALNNIYALENKKSAHTGEAILKLSDLVRYMLYETSSEKVPIENEIEYIKNYIDLQKLGIAGELNISFNVTGKTDGKIIEPMLLIPLVENAFKHGLHHKENTPTAIMLVVDNDELFLKVENYFKENSVTMDKTKGIGLTNLKKRLELLYPGKHELNIEKVDGRFIASLKLNLKND